MSMHGQFFWYDLMTSDVAAAKKFYGAVVDWGTEDAGGGMGYTLFTVTGANGAQGVAGLIGIPEHAKGMPPCWMGYIWAEDVDATAAKLEQEGGRIHRPSTDVPGVIRFAVVGDPQGAGFLIAKAMPRETPPPPLPEGTPGTMGWRELFAGEWQSAFAFYEKLFGWTKDQAIEMGPMGTYQLFKTGGERAAGGMMTKPAAIPFPHWRYYINVQAIGAAVERIKAAGGEILMPPQEVPGPMWVVQARDPQGAFFSLVAPAP